MFSSCSTLPTRPTPPDRRWLDCCIARRSCVFYAVLIHLAATPPKHVVADRRLDAGPQEQQRGPRVLSWVGPALAPSHAFGPMVQSYRPVLIERAPLAVSCLAVAPSTASQWNQRKLAPNYSPISVKDGSGAAGVSVREAWVAESLRDRGLQSAQRTRRTRTEARDTITRTEKQEAQPRPPFSGRFVPQSGLPPPLDATTETTCVPSLIQQD